MNYVINWGMLKHPLNWLTVVLMVLIASAAFHFVLAHISNCNRKPSELAA